MNIEKDYKKEIFELENGYKERHRISWRPGKEPDKTLTNYASQKAMYLSSLKKYDFNLYRLAKSYLSN